MTTLEKIKAELEQLTSRYSISKERGGMGQVEWSDRLIKESDVFRIIDKYAEQKPIDYQQGYIDGVNQMVKELKAEQEPCDECKYKTFTELYFHTDPEMVEQQPCDDAISREELLKAINTWDKFGCNADTKLVPYQDHYIPYIHYDDVIKCIKGMPSVRPKEQTGHWRAIYQGDEIINYRCSECEFGNTFNKSTYRMNYCPNCGAKMVEPQESK